MQTDKQALEELAVKVGEKVKFDSERCRYTVRAANNRFAIMTKPFNAQNTYLYTIIDIKRGVRGACNLIFGLPCDVDSEEGAAEAMSMIDRGDMEVSRRRFLPLTDSEKAALSQETDNAG